MIIERYILAEVLRPLLATLAVLLVIFVGYSSGRYLTDAVNGLLEVGDLSSLILLRAAIALEVLLPVALYLSVVIGLGRLHADAEITALHACGVGRGRILRVVFALSVLLAAVVAALSLYGRPSAYEHSYWIRARAEADIDLDRLQAGSFLEGERQRRVIFVERIDPESGDLEGIFIRQRGAGGGREVVYARHGRQRTDSQSGRRALILHDARVYALQAQRTRDVHGRVGELVIHLREPEPVEVGYKRKAAPTVELMQSVDPGDVAELQWRLSTPLSTVLIGLLGVLVSGAGARSSRYTKALAAALVYAVYYNLGAMAKTLVETGAVASIPGLWWVPLLLAMVIGVLLRRPRRSYRRAPAPAS